MAGRDVCICVCVYDGEGRKGGVFMGLEALLRKCSVNGNELLRRRAFAGWSTIATLPTYEST